MAGLRWTLGIVAALVAALWLAAVMFGNGFRASFGASQHGPLFTLLPILGAAFVVASVSWPEHRGLMHATAVLIVALLALAVYVAREAPFVATLCALYAAGWLSLYWRAVWRR